MFDRDGYPVANLRAENFRVFDEKKEMEIKPVYVEEAPLSTVILLDMSSSMRSSIDYVREALRRFISSAGPEDDFCLVPFNGEVDVSCEFSRDAEAILRTAMSVAPAGKTAFYDAVIAAFRKLRRAQMPGRQS